MNDRLDTLTDNNFRLNKRVNDLETNLFLLGMLCTVVGFYLFVRDRKSV